MCTFRKLKHGLTLYIRKEQDIKDYSYLRNLTDIAT